MLYKYDFGSIWESQNVINENAFIRELRKRLITEFKTEWSMVLQNSERYTFYRTIKPTWMKENYLFALDKKPFRDIYVCFRAGFTNLFTHKMKYYNDGSDNLYICPACREDFECEVHLLLICPVYGDLRCRYAPILSNTHSVEELGKLLSTQDFATIRALASFLYYAFKRRREAVQTAIADDVL